ncbi:MAG: hypothetical protein IJZ56_03320 [Oscillospiraceae bacterium]|nr:hypothetical protein [Oscillospiraceae bacterium]
MREILFRGQTRKYGEKVRMCDGQKLPGRWVYGGVLQGVGDHSIIYGGENENDPSEGLEKWCVHTDTLGQFTGLTDKNGKRIFEGDILRFHGRVNYPVFWDADYGAFGSCYYRDFDILSHYDRKKIEVIGNIHDNPELLEE